VKPGKTSTRGLQSMDARPGYTVGFARLSVRSVCLLVCLFLPSGHCLTHEAAQYIPHCNPTYKECVPLSNTLP
jgi:hypothetical protein